MDSNFLPVVQQEIKTVTAEITAREQELTALRETLTGLRRLEARYKNGTASLEKPVSLVQVILETLEAHDELHISGLRAGLVTAGIQTTDGTINTTLYELKNRGLVQRKAGLRGVWRLFRPGVELLALLQEFAASEGEPLTLQSLDLQASTYFPEAFGSVGAKLARFDLLTELRKIPEVLIEAGSSNPYIRLRTTKPKF